MPSVRGVVAIGLLVMLASCAGGDDLGSPLATLTFTGPERSVELRVEVADDRAERARGLMGRESLPEDRGMAFLFDAETTSGFWMKDTLIPLSIAFWDRGGRIVQILDMRPCEADPCPTYRPGVPYVGAVEVNRGWFERNGVAIGDRVELRA
jgi:uncharacterized membrane protein (UPF0127 family)